MTQLDDIAFSLLAAGSAVDPKDGSTYLLYVDPKTSSLVSKLWKGVDVEKIGHAETIAESVRPNSTASYIIGSSIRLIAYISSNNELRVCEFNGESDEWVDDPAISQYKVHPHGHVIAVLFPNNWIRIIFQDTLKRFNILDKVYGLWTSTIIPVEPTASSPIGAGIGRDQLHIFYVSANANSLHYVVEEKGGTWKDVAVTNCTFDDKSKPKRWIVMPGSTSEDWFQLFVMSEENTMWQFTSAMEKLEKLGSMNGNEFDPDDSEQSNIYINGNAYFTDHSTHSIHDNSNNAGIIGGGSNNVLNSGDNSSTQTHTSNANLNGYRGNNDTANNQTYPSNVNLNGYGGNNNTTNTRNNNSNNRGIGSSGSKNNASRYRPDSDSETDSDSTSASDIVRDFLDFF